MTRLFIPVDRSPQSLHAVQHAVTLARRDPGIELHLLYVEQPMPGILCLQNCACSLIA